MTIGDIRQDGAIRLRLGDIETPILDANILLAYTLCMEKGRLLSHSTEGISDEKIQIFNSLVSRRIEGECIAYLIGKKEFRGLDFKVSKAVLVPRPETELLIEKAIAWIDAEAQGRVKLLDLCTGSGCIAVSIKSERPGCEVAAGDISEDSLRIAKDNAANILKSQGDSYIQAANTSSISFYKSDLFTDIPGKYNLILSNPPYIPSAAIPLLKKEVSNEPILALDGGTDGLAVIRKIIEDARDYLEPGGRLFIESDPNQIPEIVSLYTDLGYDEINVYKDLSDNNRVSGARYLPLVK